MYREPYVLHIQILHLNITNVSFSRICGFNSESTICSVKADIFKYYITDAAGHFAAECYAISLIDLTVSYCYTLTGNIDAQTIRIPT